MEDDPKYQDPGFFGMLMSIPLIWMLVPIAWIFDLLSKNPKHSSSYKPETIIKQITGRQAEEAVKALAKSAAKLR